jgi:hypothetical protein
MGFIDDKTQSINNVALLEVLNNLPKSKVTSSLESVNSKSKNLLPFLLDLLSTTCKDKDKNNRAKCEATSILTDILVEFYPVLIRILKDGINKGIKSCLACGVDFKIPSNNPPSIRVKVNNIDFGDLLKINPNSKIGSMFYNKSPNEDFNWFLYNLIQTGGSGSWKNIDGVNIVDVTYFNTSQEFEMSVSQPYHGKSFNKFLFDYTNSIDLIPLQNMLPKINDMMTGSLTSNLEGINFSLDKLISIEKINVLQDKINNSDPCKEEYTYDDSYFSFTNEENFEVENTSNQKKVGVVYLDLGCGTLPVTSSPDVMKNISDNILNTPVSKVDVVIKQSINLMNDNLTINVPDEDRTVAKQSLNLKMIESLPKVFTSVILEPKIVSLYQLSSKTVNDTTVDETNGFDFVKITRVFFEYVTRESLAALVEIVFKRVKKEILALVEEITLKIVKEKVKIRIKSINSIISGASNGLLNTIPTPNSSKYI